LDAFPHIILLNACAAVHCSAQHVHNIYYNAYHMCILLVRIYRLGIHILLDRRARLCNIIILISLCTPYCICALYIIHLNNRRVYENWCFREGVKFFAVFLRLSPPLYDIRDAYNAIRFNIIYVICYVPHTSIGPLPSLWRTRITIRM